MIKNRVCERCATTTAQELSAQPKENGSLQVGWYCPACATWNKSDLGGLWIKHELLVANGVDIETLPIVNFHPMGRCARCYARGVELHHWAPSALVGGRAVADTWPTDYLCPPCHREWHELITPGLVNQQIRRKA